MKLDTLLIIAAAGAGLYIMSRTLKNAVATATPTRPYGTASSLNNGGALPMTNGGGFSNLPSYLVFDNYKAPYDPFYGT